MKRQHLIASLLALLFGGCMNYPEFVEARDVKFLEMREIGMGSERCLYLRGFVFHSALAVKQVDIGRHDGQPWVRIALEPTGPGRSGAFELRVPIPGPDARVWFGPSRTLLWPVSRD